MREMDTKLAFLSALLFAVLVCPGAQAQQERQKTASPPVTATIEPAKFETVVGEPVILLLKIRNNTDKTVRIDLGYNSLTAFKFKIFDAKGSLLAAPPQYEPRDLRHIIEVGGPIIGVRPKELYEHAVVLDRWYQPKTTGSYKVMCEFEPNTLQRAIARAHRQPIPGKSLPGYVPIPACETTINKLPYNESKIRAACDKYLAHALTGNGMESQFAIDYLAFCHAPISDENLLGFLDKLRWPTKALRYLVERRAEVSEEALLELYNDDRMSDWAKKDMVRILRPLCYDTEEEPRLARNALRALKQIGDPWALKQPPVKVKTYSLERQSDTVAGWQLSVRWKKEYYVGESILIKLMLVNNSQDIIVLPTDFALHDKTVTLTVFDDNRIPVPLTERGEELQKAKKEPSLVKLSGIRPVQPREGRIREIALAEIFAFPRPGTYYVTVEALTAQHNTRCVLREGKGEEAEKLPKPWRDIEPYSKMALFSEKIDESQASVVLQDIPIVIVDAAEEVLQPPEKSSNWLVPGLIIGSIVLAGVVLLLILRRVRSGGGKAG